VFSLHDPYRVVVDVQAARRPLKRAPAPPPAPAGSAERFATDAQRQLRPVKLILDPGHGGKDAGAVGRSGLTEKVITLDIAKRARRLLQQLTERRYRAVLTRDRDTFVPLEERTALANNAEGDLFISIHANAAKSRSLRGIETYFLNSASTERERRVAARENNTTLRRMSDLEFILNDLILSSKLKGSKLLAGIVQDKLIGGVRKRYRKVRNLGVKRGPFYVLLGARMPSVLVETAFLTNKEEERRLRSPSYRQLVARALVRGILGYSERVKLGTRTERPQSKKTRLAGVLGAVDRREQSAPSAAVDDLPLND
jgi:N-acetylmuramoyl-L-alanine amidase